MAVLPRSDVAVVGVKAVVAVACSMLVALVSRDSQHMQVAVVVRLMWMWSKGGQVGSVVVKRARAALMSAGVWPLLLLHAAGVPCLFLHINGLWLQLAAEYA